MAKDFKIQSIQASDLELLTPLLNESAGYAVDLSAEREYFLESNPTNWFYCSEAGLVVGFIRTFDQADWGHAEFFVSHAANSRTEIGRNLLNALLASELSSKWSRIRFDVLTSDQLLSHLVREYTDKAQHYLNFEKDISSSGSDLPDAGTTADIEAIAEVMCNLHPVGPAEVTRWIEQGPIHVLRSGSLIVAAAQLFRREEAYEINRIATHKDFLRKGHGRILLSLLSDWVYAQGANRLVLKVEGAKVPAIALYKDRGFVRVPSRDQIWYTKYLR